jgi:SAM-dependent methyltransferase
MIFKTDWKNHLHKIRKNEIDKIFNFLGNKKFETGLEIGCGDGFQSSILALKFNKFISADLNFDRIKIKVPNIEYVKCDADNFEDVFKNEQFDVIFTSSFLEHLSNPIGFLENSKNYLKKDGYAINIVPSRFMKISYILMFYPNLFILFLYRLLNFFKGKTFFSKVNNNLENNINKKDFGQPLSKSRIKMLWPSLHGNYRSHFQEFIMWGDKNWSKLFADSGYKIIAKLKGQVHSGYGFGFDTIRNILEAIKFHSTTIFILQKND